MALSNKVALVTGAAMGIGRAMTEVLLKNGAKVALLDINAGAGKTLVEDLEKKFGKDRMLFTECDVESEEQVKASFQKTVDTFGGIDIVCNNAGILNETEWVKTVSINLLAMIRVSYVALDHMNKLSGGRGGVVVNTASIAGLGPLPSCPVYTATKHGVIGFTRAMAPYCTDKGTKNWFSDHGATMLPGSANSPDLNPFENLWGIFRGRLETPDPNNVDFASLGSDYGIRFNAICPGFVETDLFTNIPKKLGRFSHLNEMTQGLVENFGVMSVSRVAEGLMELLSDETKTGQAIVIQPTETKYIEFPSYI